MRTRSSAAALAALVALSVPAVTTASEGESALSVAAGGAGWMHDSDDADELGPAAGGMLLVSYERGLSDSLWWRVDISGGLYSGDGASWTGTAAAGIVYRFDVIKYVPYAMLELGGLVLDGGPIDDEVLAPLVLVGLGVDILRDRDSSWGVAARAGGVIGDSSVLSVAARYTWRWGYF